jgi:transketolase
MTEYATLRALAQQLRVDAVRASAEANSGHPTSALSAAELMAVLLADHLRYDFADPDNPANDRLIFSKGHASPLLYALFKAVGAITDEQLRSYRRFGSLLEGHPTPRLPWVDAATGSLGQGLPVGVGMALAGKRLARLDFRVWVLCGDSEMAEGSMWEAFEHAAHADLDNLTAIIDVNRLGQRGPTMHGWDLGAYATRARAFGWHAIEVDGHDVGAVDAAYRAAADTKGQPTVIIARTVKGRGVEAVADQPGKHGKPISDPEAAVAEIGGAGDIRVDVTRPLDGKPYEFPTGERQAPHWQPGEQVATRDAFGKAFAAFGAWRGDVVGLDGEVADSTRMQKFAERVPERFFQMYIAEQQMIAAAVGMQVLGYVPFAASFAAFLTRAYDFVRMAAVSRAHLCLVGSHAGVSIGMDGPSQMGLEDLAMFRAVWGSTVLYPCDANQTAQLVPLMADRDGICYLRTTRDETPVIYDADDRFGIGGSRLVRASSDDAVAICAAGITVHEARKAADALAAEGIAARVVDCYTVKPLDKETVRDAAARTGRVVTVEDHWAEGGLGDAVLDALADTDARVCKLAVRDMPTSGNTDELLAAAGIDAGHIADAARRMARA